MLDQILQNTADKIEIDVYYDNVLTAPTSILIREIRDPNGAVILTNQTVTAGSTTGRYEYTLAALYTATLGVYSAIWRFVITIGGVNTTYEHTQYFEIVSSLRYGYVTPFEVRQKSIYDKITDTEPTDAVLQKYIDRSTLIIDNYLGGSINYAIYSEKRRCVLDKVHNGVHIQLARRPIISLTSVQLIQGPTTTLDLNTTYIRINEAAGYLEYFQDVSSPTLQICTFDPTATQIVPEASVVYTAGFITVPEEVKMAAIMVIEDLFGATNGDDVRLTAFTIGDTKEQYSNIKNAQYEDDALNNLGIRGARSITKMLAKYRQPYKTMIFAGPLG